MSPSIVAGSIVLGILRTDNYHCCCKNHLTTTIIRFPCSRGNIVRLREKRGASRGSSLGPFPYRSVRVLSSVSSETQVKHVFDIRWVDLSMQNICREEANICTLYVLGGDCGGFATIPELTVSTSSNEPIVHSRCGRDRLFHHNKGERLAVTDAYFAREVRG